MRVFLVLFITKVFEQEYIDFTYLFMFIAQEIHINITRYSCGFAKMETVDLPPAARDSVTAADLQAYVDSKAALAEAIKAEGVSFLLPRRAAAGLVNQGATCYMNSLLQALFWTHEFRDRLYQAR